MASSASSGLFLLSRRPSPGLHGCRMEGCHGESPGHSISLARPRVRHTDKAQGVKARGSAVVVFGLCGVKAGGYEGKGKARRIEVAGGTMGGSSGETRSRGRWCGGGGLALGMPMMGRHGKARGVVTQRGSRSCTPPVRNRSCPRAHLLVQRIYLLSYVQRAVAPPFYTVSPCPLPPPTLPLR